MQHVFRHLIMVLCASTLVSQLAGETTTQKNQSLSPGIMQQSSKIYVAGHHGLVGSALMRALMHQGFTNIITRSSAELDLRNQAAVNEFFAQEKPEFVFLAAATVGGIHANNTKRAQFLYDNLMIEANVVDAAYRHQVKKLLLLGSSCIYPRNCPQPMREEYLLTGSLEQTNEPYAIAKIAGLKLVESYNRQYGTNFISCMPTNLYGPNDNFDLNSSHVLPAMIRKFSDAKKAGTPSVTLWGTGVARREFLQVDDMAEACIFLMQNYTDNTHINIGTGQDVSIRELAELIKQEVGYTGDIIWDSSMPDGTPQKLLNVDRLTRLGWSARTSLQDGIRSTVAWFNKHADTVNTEQSHIQLSPTQTSSLMTRNGRTADYPIHEIFLQRSSPRAMSGESITHSQLMTILEAGRWAPSSYNNQPWRFIYAHRNTSAWSKFFDLLVPFNQEWAKNAAALVVVASKKTFADGTPMPTHSFDTGAAWMSIALQGSMQGLVVHGMGGFDYAQARNILNIPEEYAVEMMFAVGKPGNSETLPEAMRSMETPSSRTSLSDLVFEATFDNRSA